MMIIRWLSLILAASLAATLTGCLQYGDDDRPPRTPAFTDDRDERSDDDAVEEYREEDDDPPGSPSPPPFSGERTHPDDLLDLACSPEEHDRRQDLADLVYHTDVSVHEIVVCAGLQARLAASFILVVLASNPDFFSPEVLESLEPLAAALGLVTTNPFADMGGGSWGMPLGDSADGSWFTVRLYDSADRIINGIDPFTMESYLVGASVRSSHTFAEMREVWSRRSTFTITYDDPGPLAHLLADGGPLPDSGFTLQLSLLDFLWLIAPDYVEDYLGDDFTRPDFGPFESLVDIQLDGRVSLADRRGDTLVTYDAQSPRTALSDYNDLSLDFDITGLTADNGTYYLEGDTDGIQYVSDGLAGEIRYEIRSDDEVAIDVLSDYGDGSAYPTNTWVCPGE